MATLTITKKSQCAAGGHYVLTFSAGAQSLDVPVTREEIREMVDDPGDLEVSLKHLLALLARVYTLPQLGAKLNAGPITVTL